MRQAGDVARVVARSEASPEQADNNVQIANRQWSRMVGTERRYGKWVRTPCADGAEIAESVGAPTPGRARRVATTR